MKVAIISSAVQGSTFTSPPISYGGLEEITALRAKFFMENNVDVYLFALTGSEASWLSRYSGNAPHYIEENNEYDFLKHKDVLDEVDFIIDDGWTGTVSLQYINKSIKVWHGPNAYINNPLLKQFAVSKAHADLLFRYAGIRAGVIYNAVNPEEYPFVEDKEDYLLYMNRIDVNKGAHVFLNLCKELNTKCYMIGDDLFVEPNYSQSIIRNIPSNVEYLGRVPDKVKLDLLGHAKMLVAPLLPFYFEVFGLYAVESALMGTPLIAFRNGALPEIAPCARFADSYEELVKLAKTNLSGKGCREKALKWDYRIVWKDLLNLINKLK